MATNIEFLQTPDIQFSGFYFPDIVAMLRRFNRVYAPEITNEDSKEPFIQGERSFALVGHLNNVLLDMLASEVFLRTARTPQSVKLILELIDYKMLASSPATVEMLGTLVRTYTTPIRLFDSLRKFATKRSVDQIEILFENQFPVDFEARTDQISDAYTRTGIKTGLLNTSSFFSDIITYVSGDQWTTSDLNNYIQISDSVLNNNTEELRIIELIDEFPVGSGFYSRLRLEDASFVSEENITWKVKENVANVANDIVAGTPTSIFTTAPVQNDTFYFGHLDILFDRFDLLFNVAPSWGINGVVEFFDDSETSYQPDLVTVDPPGSPGFIRFELNTFLGVEERSGALIRVMHVPSGEAANAFSSWVGGKNVVDINGYIFQATPSTLISDYLVFSTWRPIDVLENTTKIAGVTWVQDGYTKFNLPQTQSDVWSQYSIYDKGSGTSREGYYLRLRIIDNPGAVASPQLTSLKINTGSQYNIVEVIQGKTIEDNPLGSSSGEANQRYVLNQTPYIENSLRIFVDEGGGYIEWIIVITLLTSRPSDRHCVIDTQSDGSVVVEFGDGANGKVPPIGTNNIKGIYRIGAEENGNIGANTLTVNRDGVGVYSSINNPRVGTLWSAADWNTVESFERVKREGPKLLRTLYRAVTPSDCEILARTFRTSTGVRPVARAKAYEETYGPKTIELVVVGQGGSALNQEYLTTLNSYFNGGDIYKGVLLMNNQLYLTNYTPRKIPLNITIIANTKITESIIKQTLSSLLSPTALEADRVTYVWNPGEEIPLSRINSEIFNISPGSVTKVTITSPSADIQLASKELPIFDPINSQIIVLNPGT